MSPFRRRARPEPRSLDELIAEARAIVGRARPPLRPDEDFVASVLTSGRDGTEFHTFTRPGGELQEALARITRRADRFVFWTTAWQGDDSNRVEVVLLQAAEHAAGREEVWRARLLRVSGRPPKLAPWERVDQPVPLD